MPHDKGNLTVRLPLETQKKLDHIASNLARSRNWVVNEASENYVDVYEWQEKKIRERLKKAEKGGTFHTGDRADKIVDSFKP